MVHSFTATKANNGNYTVTFLQDGKRRNIIFQNNTEAHSQFSSLYASTNDLQAIIQHMKHKYLFKANVNNTSIFRPIHKSLILNN